MTFIKKPKKNKNSIMELRTIELWDYGVMELWSYGVKTKKKHQPTLLVLTKWININIILQYIYLFLGLIQGLLQKTGIPFQWKKKAHRYIYKYIHTLLKFLLLLVPV